MTFGRSFRWRLMFWMLLVFAAGIAMSGLFAYHEIYGAAGELRKRALQGQADELLKGLRVTGDGRLTVVLPPEWEDAYRNPDLAFAYTLYDGGGRAILVSPNLRGPLPYSDRLDHGGYGRVDFVGAQELATLAVRARHDHTLVVARRGPDLEALSESLLEESAERLAIIVAFIVASFPLIWGITGWSLRPLARASQEAAAVGPASPSRRIGSDRLPQEIRPLVDAVNGALERLAHAYEAERRFTTDAAHALRTPLTVLNLRLQRAKLERAVDWSAVDGDLADMNRLVDQLLDLARKEDPARSASDVRRVNLSRLVREAAATVLPLAEQSGRPVEVEVGGAISLDGRADDLRDMIRNGLDNAVKHGRGMIQIALRVEVTDSVPHAVLDIADEGPGVSAALRETAFDRFRKGTTSAGAGLGLAIVRQVARAHGGDARFVLDQHCRLRIALPIDRADGPVGPAPQATVPDRRTRDASSRGALSA